MRYHFALILALSLVLLPALAFSDMVTPEEASMVAENFIEHQISVRGGWGDSPTAVIAGMTELRRGDRLLGYHFSLDPEGHIVVPATKALTPVKSFSYTEDYANDSEVGYWALLKDAMEYTLVRIEERHGPPNILRAVPRPKAIGETWDWLLSSGAPPETFATVGPIVMTRWDQDPPLNDNCPMGDGGRCIVGCVATAGAQVMRYWRHPSHGVGSHSYFWNGDQSCGGSTSGQTLNEDFTNAYDWWNMKRWYVTYNPDQAAAVAELCYDLGVAFQMDYGYCGSSAYTGRGVTVYPTWFKYLDTVDKRDRISYPSRQAWFDLLRAEFDAVPPRPIHYRIQNHSIVCDGYMDDGGLYVHLNYGWGGSYNDWYAVDSLYCSWEGCGPEVEYAVIGIEPGADFIDMTAGPLGDTGNTYGVAWGDYNGDGYEDLYLANSGSANRLLRNNGDSTFTDVTASPLNDAGSGRGVAWGDYDNDGDLDLYLCNTSGGANKLFENDAGSFADATTGPLGDTGNSEGAVWADFTNDGNLDLYIVNNGSANKLLMGSGNGIFADVTTGPLGDTGNGYGAAVGDYDGDGYVDIYIVNSGGNKLLRNQGTGSFTDVTSGPLGDASDGRCAAWGDYDNDEDLDLYIVNHGDANLLLRNDGGSFTDVTSGPLGDAGDGWGAAWAEYENDRDLDLYVSNSSGDNLILRNRGGGDFQDMTVDPMDDAGDGKGVAWGDFDNDGLSDLYLANSGGANRLYHNEYQNHNHWLQVRLVGVYSNAAGIGARVRVVTGTDVQIREISGGSGYCSQNSLVAGFGLGGASTVDSVRVYWPSGVVLDTTLVAADQLIELIEVDVSGVEIAGADESGLRLFPSYPNPFDRSTTIRYSLPHAGPVALRVYDVSGRVVRTLVDSKHMSAGEHFADWTGENEAGEPAASGVYFYRVEAGRNVETRRMVLLR
jgi:hypothetical protein